MTPAHDTENNERQVQKADEGEDECGPHTTGHNVTLVEFERIARQKMVQNLNIDSNEFPSYPRYASHEERLRSFKNWPAGIAVSPKALTDAGFFYSSQGDRTYCFQCGGMLEGWCASDNPWNEHVRWYPTCKLVSSLRENMVIDDTFVKEFRKRARAQEDMKAAISTVQDVVSTIDTDKVNPSNLKSIIETLKIIVSEVDTGKENISTHDNFNDDSNDQQAALSEVSETSESSSSSNSKSISCVICLTRARNALLLPCLHIATCSTCASKLKNCCVCRLAVIYHIRVYIS